MINGAKVSTRIAKPNRLSGHPLTILALSCLLVDNHVGRRTRWLSPNSCQSAYTDAARRRYLKRPLDNLHNEIFTVIILMFDGANGLRISNSAPQERVQGSIIPVPDTVYKSAWLGAGPTLAPLL